MQQPNVSIIIPTYNRAHLIRETLDSVWGQLYKNWECIIVDDGSTDSTSEIVKPYLEDLRFKYYERPLNRHKGANACRNYGIEISKGEFLQFLDSDDILSPDKIKHQIELIINNGDADLVFCQWKRFQNDIEESQSIVPSDFYTNYNSGIDFLESLGENNSFMCSHSYLMNKNILNKSGYWNEYLESNQDGEFFFRVLINSKKIIFCPDVTVFYRVSVINSVSSYSSAEKVRQVIASWQLMENQLILKYGDKLYQYIENGKKRVFIDLNKSRYLKIKFENRDFFKYQLIQEKRYLKSKRFHRRLIKKIYNLFNKNDSRS
tara:strand:+ start:666 stop:1622 length:957 start_codon:yes stop_codon:yes gene_type:complete